MAVRVQVQDVAHGCPAGGVEVRLERQSGRSWVTVDRATTDDEGRIDDRWGSPGGGVLRLVIDAEKFFAALGLPAALAEVSAVLRLVDPGDEILVSVLLAPVACTVHTVGPRS